MIRAPLQVIYGNWADDEPTSDDDIRALIVFPFDESAFQSSLDALVSRLDASSLLWLEVNETSESNNPAYVCRRKLSNGKNRSHGSTL